VTPAELLDRVADRLETRGWTRLKFGLAEGPNCLSGAIVQERLDRRYESGIEPGVCLLARRALEQCMKPNSIITWNDRVCGSQAEAVAMVRRAARWADSELAERV